MVGVLEAFIGMRGSTGSVGTGNPAFQTGNVSPLYGTVFQTPAGQSIYFANQQMGNLRYQHVQQEINQQLITPENHSVHQINQQQKQQEVLSRQNSQVNISQENQEYVQEGERQNNNQNFHQNDDNNDQLKR